MRKYFILGVVSMLVALTLIGCQNDIDENINPEGQQISVTIEAGNADTKATYEGGPTGAIHWESGDALGVYVSTITGVTESTISSASLLFSAATTGATTNFTGTITEVIGVDTYNLYGLFPHSAIVVDATDDVATKLRVLLPAVQHPSLTSFDPKADILFAMPKLNQTVSNMSINTQFQFARPFAFTKLSFTGAAPTVPATEKILKVTMTVSDETIHLAGRFYTNIKDNTIIKDDVVVTMPNNQLFYYGGTNEIVLDYKNVVDVEKATLSTLSAFAAWFVMNPVQLVESGAKVTIKIETDTYYLTSLPQPAINFSQGKVNTASLALNTFTAVPKPTYLYHENFGTQSDKSVAGYTGWEKGGIDQTGVTYSFTGTDSEIIKTTSPSNYTGASGDSNAYMPSTGGTLNATGINFGDSDYLDFSIGLRNASSSYTIEYMFNNGGAVKTTMFPIAEKTSPGTWGLVTYHTIVVPTGATLLNIYVGGTSVRFDDMQLSKTLIAPTPVFTATTDAATEVGNQIATLNGTITLINTTGDVKTGFEYCKTSDLPNYVEASPTTIAITDGKITFNLTTLTNDEEYTYRAWVSHNGGTPEYGEPVTFMPTGAEKTYYTKFTGATLESGSYIMVATRSGVDYTFAEYESNKFIAPEVTIDNIMGIESNATTDAYVVDIDVTGTSCTISRTIATVVNYVQHNGNGTNINYSEISDNWTIITVEGGGFRLQSTTIGETDRYIGRGNTTTKFGAYNNTGSYVTALHFYKKGSESGGGTNGDEPITNYIGCLEMPFASYGTSSTFVETFGGTTGYKHTVSGNDNQVIITHTVEEDGVLKRNYTILYDKTKKAPLWAAYVMHQGYFPKIVSRTDTWKNDPALTASEQQTGETYGGNYDKGHIVASGDRLSSELCNSQTFYHTNIAPQWDGFNGGVWSTLEGKTQTDWNPAAGTTDTLYMVTGVVYKDIIGVTEKGGYEIPSHFYKVLVKCKFNGTEVSSAQGIGFYFTNETHTGEPYDLFTKSIDYIETQTGFDFFANLPEGVETTAESNDNLTSFTSF